MTGVTSADIRPPIATDFPVRIEQPARYSDLGPSCRIGRDALAIERDAFGADLTTRIRSRHETSVRYACGLFDGPRCLGLAEALGAHHAPGEDGDPVESARSFEPFRMRGR